MRRSNDDYEVIRIVLNQDQADLLTPILNASKAKIGFEGVLATVARAYSPATGGTVVELQVAEMDKATVRKIQRVLHPIQKEVADALAT